MAGGNFNLIVDFSSREEHYKRSKECSSMDWRWGI